MMRVQKDAMLLHPEPEKVADAGGGRHQPGEQENVT
jgi:hypothetical protein